MTKKGRRTLRDKTLGLYIAAPSLMCHSAAPLGNTHTVAPSWNSWANIEKRIVWSLITKKESKRKHNTTDFESCSKISDKKKGKEVNFEVARLKGCQRWTSERSCSKLREFKLSYAAARCQQTWRHSENIPLPTSASRSPRSARAQIIHISLCPDKPCQILGGVVLSSRPLWDRCFPHFSHFSLSSAACGSREAAESWRLWLEWRPCQTPPATPCWLPVNIHHKERSY